MGHGNQAVRITGVSHNNDSDVLCRGGLNCFARVGKDGAVNANQVGSFHPLFTRDASDQDDEIHVSKRLFKMIAVALDDARKRREGTVIQFHMNAVQGSHHGGNFNQMENDWTMCTKNLTRCESK